MSEPGTERIALKHLDTPRSMEIMVTGGCNLACRYCGYAGKMAEKDDMSTEAWVSLFDEMAECNVIHVNITGGEPLVRPDLFTLIDAVIKRRMRFSLVSNATLFTKDRLDRLRDTGRLHYLQVSVDSTTATVHDSLRGKGSCDATLRGLAQALEMGLRTRVRITLSPINLPTLATTLDALADMGVCSMSVHEVVPLGAASRDYANLKMSPEHMQEAWRVAAEFNAKRPGILFGHLLEEPELARTAGETAQRGGTLDEYCGFLTTCSKGHEEISVLHNGYYAPCQLAEDVYLGRVGQDRLIDVWQHSPRLSEWRQRYGTPLESYESCRGCSYRRVCKGGCPAVAYALTGDFTNPDTLWCHKTLVEDGRYAENPSR